MNPRNLLDAFQRWSDQGRDLVLATVFETAGSTYSKTGARMLMTADGKFQGMLSGGCLEGDLASRAQQVSESGVPQSVTYDLGRDDEELWGLGVGCDGLMRIFLQPLAAGSGYQPFAAMAAVYAGDEPGVAVTVLESESELVEAGATLVQAGAGCTAWGIAESARLETATCVAESLERTASFTRMQDVAGRKVHVLYALLQPPPRILVLGGGPDAEPVVRLIAELGWRVIVQDHRPAYIQSGNFEQAEAVLNEPVAGFGKRMPLSGIDAVIVMSHHLQSDRAYLEWLSSSKVPYVGLLGPIDRRRRLLDDLGPAASGLAGRVHGPAGMDIGGRGPASIALSIIAEIHEVLARRKRI
ncbi:MAG: XdhC family protein [Woeseiaceae bacterium]|nr:XdhC family protein [Woeseiaceae bacterium]